jgi:hypothetical protein
LEPSFGGGDFLFPAVERLLSSYRKHTNLTKNVVEDLRDSIRAVELHRDTFKTTRSQLASLLQGHGIGEKEAGDSETERFGRKREIVEATWPRKTQSDVNGPKQTFAN